jgi:ParB family chromosome partitioning protein
MIKGKRKVLGKGLEALIPREKGVKPATAGLFECPVEQLTPNEDQPRQSFDERKLRELAESLKTSGVIEPLIVRKQGGGLEGPRFQIVAGERRWRAAKLAGMTTVPVLVKDLSAAEMLEVSLIENIQREDLNPLEEAEAYRQLVEEHGLTQEQLAKRVGRQRSSVANMLRLLRLPAEVRRFLLTGELSMGHARAILGVSGQEAQAKLARRVVREKLSVRQCEDLVRSTPSGADKPGRSRAGKPRYGPVDRRLVESLQRRLGTKVDLRRGAKGGKLVIHYYSPEELNRLVATIEGR